MLALAGSSLGQGQINGINYNAANNVLGQVTLADGATLAGSETMGQLYVGVDAASLAPVGTAKAFLQNGIISLGTVDVPGIAAGADAMVQLKSWSAAGGSSYEAASGMPGQQIGESNIITIALGGGTQPPAYLSGLTATAMTIVPVPEPSTLALLALGLGAFALRRRK